MNDSGLSLVPSANTELIEHSGIAQMLDRIRPEWKAKNLIQRVVNLVSVDPSSACQRIFNASIHDLKGKIVVAGLDIAQEAAKQNKFPEISRAEHIDELDTKRTINLAYRMGLLTRPEWRRILRVYDIRRDLEHEDDEYEATVEDCFYIFTTCIEVVLSRDPIQVLKLTDIKALIEAQMPVVVTQETLDDYSSAPNVRQTEILKFLVSTSLDPRLPDIIRHNAYNVMGAVRANTSDQVRIEIAQDFVERIQRKPPDFIHFRVAHQAGVLPYLKKSQLKQFFSNVLACLEKTGHSFRSHDSHREILQNLQDVGGLTYCPDEILLHMVEWLVLCYIGEPGGYGDFGSRRKVFYSNIGAPMCEKILALSGKKLVPVLEELRKNSQKIQSVLHNEWVARRFENILDIFNE